MKRLLFLVCTLLCANVLFAQTRFWIDSLQYEVTSTNPAEVEVNNATSAITTANIPSTINYYGTTYSVTSIGNYAFEDCSSLTSVTIPNSVTSIGTGAFYECYSLTSVDIPNSVTSIGNSAFYGCESLTSVDIPNSVTSIGDYAFYYCSSLTSITIPNSVTSIGGSAFSSCYDLTSVTCLAETAPSLGVDVFYGTPNNKTLTIPCGCESEYTDWQNATTWAGIDCIVTIGSLFTIGDLTYKITSETEVKVQACTESATSVVIPETVTYQGTTYSVTSIGNYAFYDCSSLTSVTIPNSVTTIGDYAFSYCSSLTSITIPNSVTSIGGAAFLDCSSLTSVTLSNNITELPCYDDYYGFFENCSSLTSITIGNSVTSIGKDAFRNCSSLTSVTIPNSVTAIGNSAFWNCSSLTSVTIPNNVTSIGNYAFYDCSSLTSVTIPNSVTSIGDYTFYDCSSLTSVTIPNSVTSIGDYTFYGCRGLTSVTIPNSVTSIGKDAFKYCSSLTSVTLPNNATIHESAFSYAGIIITIDSVTYSGNGDTLLVGNYTFTNIGLLTFYLNETAYFPTAVKVADCDESMNGYLIIPSIVTYDGTTYSVTAIGNSAFSNCNSLTSVTIPNNVTSIGGYAFEGCSSLTSVTIPNSVTSIGNNAFSGCSSLTSVTIPNSVTSIGDYTFYDCSSLTSVTLPNSVTSIGRGAFYDCSSLTSVTLPNSVTSIGKDAFRNAGVSSDVVIDSVYYKVTPATIPESYYATLTDDSYTISGYGMITFHIGDSTYAPPTEAMVYGCKQNRSGHVDILSAIEFQGNTYPVTSIGEDAFYNCYSLNSVTIPNSVTSIGNSAFSSCRSLTSVTIPNSVTSIGGSAFSYCYSLNSVTIPNSVTSIGSSAFQSCSSLTSVTIPNSVTSIGSSAFQSCSSLTSVTIPNSVTSIGNNAFSGCSSLTSVTIPNNVTSIDYSTFRNCSSLTSVTIPNNVTSIGNYAFYDCSSLTSVSCLGENPPTLGSNAFYNTYSNKKLYIPICSRENYVNSDWNNYFDIINLKDGALTYAYNNDTLTVIDCIDSVTYIVIPSEICSYIVTSIGNSAFGDCSSLISITIPENITSIGNSAFSNCNSLISITIPENITSIGNSTFYGCNSLTSITIPENITSIGNSAFYGCSSLTSITIPENITSIGNYAFSNCNSLNTLNFNAINCNDFNNGSYHPFYNTSISTINIGDVVQRIPNYFAYNLDSLTSVTIPENVTSIGNYAFSNCNSLNSVTCLGENPSTLGSNAFYNTSSNKKLSFPICSIGNYATSDWSDYFNINIKEDGLTYVYNNNNSLKVINCVDSVTSAVIPSNICSYNITTIGNNAFYNCSNLTSITIGNNITSIEDSAFYGCSGLATLNFNAINCNDFNSNNHPFANCPISTINIDDSVQRIPNNFAYNNSLITSINVPNSVIEIGANAFNGCSNVLSISLGNNITSIKESAFYSCSNITYIDIPNSVTQIGADAFNGCDMLMLVNLGENLSFIGSNAFNSCVFLQSVNCLATIPPTLQGSNVFHYPNIATLTVPCGSLQAYSSPTSFWNIFFNDRISENGYDVVTNVNNSTWGSITVESNCYTATLTATANAGYGFLNWNDGNTENPRIVNLTSDTSFVANFGVLVVNTDITATICQGETYTENNFNVSEAGVYTQNLTSINGGDSIVTLTLNVNPIFNTELSATICEGQTYTENNFNVSEAGVYTQTLTSANGCDSIVTLTLNVNPIFNTELSANICQGQVYNENGFNVSEAGVYTQTLTSANGCDSIVTLTLNVNPIFNTELSATICEGQVYTENNFNVSEAGVYTQTLQTINGCDSIVTLTLNVNPIYNTELSANICQSQVYNENGFNVSEAGVYTQTLQTVNGCDSIVTLTLNVNPIYNTELTATICEGSVYTENNFNVSEAGVYMQTLQTANGCDSVVTLTLNVNPIFNTELVATICEGQVYTENNFNVSEAGVYTQTLTSANGCDSIVTLTLNVNPIYNTELTATICEGQVYTENNFNVSEAGVYTQTLQTVNGCDSIVTLTLNVNPIYNTELTATICEGSVYTENNFNVSEAGLYTQTLTSVNGCDSIVTLTLNVNPIFNTELTATICEGQTYIENNFNVSEAGVYTQNLTSVNGCDSIVTLTVTEYPTFDTTINATINAGETYTEFGFNESEAGTYVQNLQTEFGCDSTITLVLSVNSSLLDVEQTEISFYPNPTDSKVTFSQAIEKVEVIDLTGKTLLTFTNAKTINIESLPAGVYYLRLTNNDKAIMRKAIKE